MRAAISAAMICAALALGACSSNPRDHTGAKANCDSVSIDPECPKAKR